ncbi:Gfo/Idh/MocA family oxidoreductase [Pseudomonas putida]|uniref:Gfo/Idh/MocA family protein n=1 Tax=Pseudomonas putida TaxID=303 RepID=UPI0023643162|nr:Gfo/Idh/MocA family oxidoreductase [Pseudomonas putida]MDD2068676.1 Gfo/Idh/MocA family oxidoreductase [Pseudomonas putida]HDS1738609.1 Gfo/Idh/MocA family oxidoreductase [Pseudomonas putida]
MITETQTPIRVGIVGLTPGRSWASMAHLPALRAMPHAFEVVGVANRSVESAIAAARAWQIPNAFSSVAQLVASPDVDLVVVTVKVPHHQAIVNAALDAGKRVYCEWPLGHGLEQARAMASRARVRDLQCIVGTQARYAPAIQQVRKLLGEGFVGECYSCSLVATGMNWGASVSQANAYTFDRSNGATMLTIAFGHAMAALLHLFGPIAELSAITATRRTQGMNFDSGQPVQLSAEDQVLVCALFENGMPLSVHFRGGSAHGAGLTLDINGSAGDLRITGNSGQLQLAELNVQGARGDSQQMSPISIADSLAGANGEQARIGNVRRLYADLSNSACSAPTFDDAVAVHRVLEAIEQAAVSKRRIYMRDIPV